MMTLVLIIELLACAGIQAQRVATAPPRRWLDSLEAYKGSIRVLESAKTRECEGLLYEILNGIDDHASCATDADCTLLSQEPFGRTVPVRVDYSRTVLEQMKQFFRICDNGSLHSVNDGTTTDVAVCRAARCMVMTSIAK